MKLNGIPENNFLCIFIIASSPEVHTFFCLWRVNKKLPQGETSQNAFQRSRSINQKWKVCMLKWAHPSLSLSCYTYYVSKDYDLYQYINRYHVISNLLLMKQHIAQEREREIKRYFSSLSLLFLMEGVIFELGQLFRKYQS